MASIRTFGRHVKGTWVPQALFATGFARIASALATSNRSILCYHGVTASDLVQSRRHIPESVFDRHLTYLKDRFDIVPLSLFFDPSDRPGKRRMQIAITFDDGYRNNLTVAAPLLRRHNVPSTFFVSGCCATGEEIILWPDLIDRVRAHVGGCELWFDGRTFTGRQEDYQLKDDSGLGLYDHIKAMSSDIRDDALEEFRDRYKTDSVLSQVDSSLWELMRPNDLAALGRVPGVTIGSHGHRHFNLGEIPSDEARRELELSRAAIQEIVGLPVNSVAFPDGSYTQQTKMIAHELGYEQLLAVDYRDPADENDPSILQRTVVSSTMSFSAQMLYISATFMLRGV